MKDVEIPAEKLEHFRLNIRTLLDNRPEGSNVLILHCGGDDLDVLIAAIKSLRKRFFVESVIPIISASPVDQGKYIEMAVALLSACYQLSQVTGKTAIQVQQDVVDFGRNLPQETILDWLKALDFQGGN